MTHKHDKQTAISFLINPSDRGIYKTSHNNITLMQNDHNSVRFSFRMARYVQGHDMSLCNKLELHYINISSDKVNKTEDIYIVKDMAIDPEEKDFVKFSWLLSNNATKYDGTLSFLIEFLCVKEDATVDYSWHTNKHTLTMTEGMDNEETVIEAVSDVLAAWEAKVVEECVKRLNEEFKTLKNDITEGNIEVKNATNATNDGNGKNIAETYETKEDAGKTKEAIEGKVNKNGDTLNGVFLLNENASLLATDEIAGFTKGANFETVIGLIENGHPIFSRRGGNLSENWFLSLHSGPFIVAPDGSLDIPFMFLGYSKWLFDNPESLANGLKEARGLLIGGNLATGGKGLSFVDEFIPFDMRRRLIYKEDDDGNEIAPEKVTVSGEGVVVGDEITSSEAFDDVWNETKHRTIYSKDKIIQWHRTTEPYEETISELVVPDKSGTIATVEDVDSAIGDISSVLDAIIAKQNTVIGGA